MIRYVLYIYFIATHFQTYSGSCLGAHTESREYGGSQVEDVHEHVGKTEQVTMKL
jgi:hypothetical protein